MPNLVKICLMGAEVLHVDGRTDRHDNPNSRYAQIMRKRQTTRYLQPQ
jgi:hypothetical protein